jgi:hypothetical protein
MSFPFRLHSLHSIHKQVHPPAWLNGNTVLLGELVGINENASFRILRTITEPAYTLWKQPGKSYFEGTCLKSVIYEDGAPT